MEYPSAISTCYVGADYQTMDPNLVIYPFKSLYYIQRFITCP